LIARARAVSEHPAVAIRSAPSAAGARPEEPGDLTALYAVTDGLELADGTRILGRGEIEAATVWLTGEKSLEWGPDLWVVGERDDLVVVRDLDPAGARAGGGVLEAPTDGLSILRRVGLDVIEYLEARLGAAAGGADRAPERAASEALAQRDAEGLARAIARGFYPGAERDLAHAALSLGGLRLGAGDAAGAMEAFAQSVTARVRAAPRGAGPSEARAGWKACAITAEKAGAPAVAEACRGRVEGRDERPLTPRMG
jgi:hypothetical protein